jgi:hypothetical protein
VGVIVPLVCFVVTGVLRGFLGAGVLGTGVLRAFLGGGRFSLGAAAAAAELRAAPRMSTSTR